MEKVVIYASKSGKAEAVARKIGEVKGYPVVSYKEVPTLTANQEVIYVGSIYAGQILGLEKVAKELAKAQHVTMVTVGLMDPELAETKKLRKEAVTKAQSKADFVVTEHLMLQGTLVLEELSFPQRTLMKAMYKQGKKNPNGKLVAIVEAIDQPKPWDLVHVEPMLSEL
ncbi:flavodoxin domain-containing protein [Enterococcus asini]|uniref:flavodoxin domain-containing protein n=1 Tax=Enterococcus asini TaxID=57732 RepID=UPI0028926A11|nr:flavodoxin domain-containing protein [Enterococcus asini]MDT2756705.1 flavodoxin domain-containing protein [Enterococcus asini]